jgi:hypothetical protein
MTRPVLFTLLGLLVFAAPKAMQAQDQDYQFTTNADDAGVTIVAYVGPGGDVIIPGTLGGLPVTTIASRAFEQTNLTSVTIPNSVTSLGSYCFFSCSILTNVSIPGSVTGVGASAFEYCTALPSITIPEGVTSIGDLAFSYCYALSSVTLGDTVSSIGNAAFFECESLTNVNIPEGVTSIGATAFNNCTSLGSVSIPGSVGDIGIEAFQSCTSLTNVTLAEGVTNIGEGAFYYCVSLESINIPEGVANIGVEAFESCASLTSLAIPASVTNIGSIAFTDCTSLSNLYFQGNAPTPGASVFLYDNNAKAYYLPGKTGWKSTYAGIPTELTPDYVVTVDYIPFPVHADISGKGKYLRGSRVTVTTSFTNDCYEFLGWTHLGKIVSTNLQYTFTLLNSQTEVAKFALLDYDISTSSSPTNWGLVVGGGKKGCGSTVTLTALPKPGFVFTNWTSSVGVITNRVYKFTVGESEDFVANFVDVKPPTVEITAPFAGENVTTSNFTVKGTASDNAAVAAVYYNLNETGWQPASSANGFKTWFAGVTLAPNSVNTVSAQAVDSSGNVSPIKGPIKFSFE